MAWAEEMGFDAYDKEDFKRIKTMVKAQGTVTYVGYKNYQNKKLWSFATGDDDNKTYYACGQVMPTREDGEKLEQGDKVRFEYDNSGKYNNVKMATLVVKAGSVPARKVPARPQQKEDWNARAKYWENKEEYDKKVAGPILNYKFALATAKDLVLKLHELELLPKPPAKKDAYDVIFAETVKVTEEIFNVVQAKAHELEFPKEEVSFEDLNEEPKEEKEEDWNDDEDWAE